MVVLKVKLISICEVLRMIHGGWACSLVIEQLPSMYEALVLFPRTAKKKK
jgi:hypothetical protein